MTDSILNSIKKNLGVDQADTSFDLDITMHTNSVLATLHQLGVGPVNGFMIEDASQTWTQFIGDVKVLNAVKSYVYLRVRLLFDPPTTSFAINSFEKQIAEFEWRINVAVETPGTTIPPAPTPPASVTVQNYDGSDLEDSQVVIKLTQDGQDIDNITVEAI